MCHCHLQKIISKRWNEYSIKCDRWRWQDETLLQKTVYFQKKLKNSKFVLWVWNECIFSTFPIVFRGISDNNFFYEQLFRSLNQWWLFTRSCISLRCQLLLVSVLQNLTHLLSRWELERRIRANTISCWEIRTAGTFLASSDVLQTGSPNLFKFGAKNNKLEYH